MFLRTLKVIHTLSFNGASIGQHGSKVNIADEDYQKPWLNLRGCL